MASTYVNNLRLNEMATGDASGTWGTTTNTNLELVGQALGYGTEGITTNANTHTSTVADGAADEARAMYIKYTGTLDSACTITIGPNTLKRVHIIENATSGSQNIIIKQGSGATVTIGNGNVSAVYLDGAGSGAAVVNAFTDLETAGTITVAGNLIASADATVGDDLSLVSDAAVLGFGADTDVTLTHVADTGLLLNSSRQLQFGDSGTYIHQSADGTLDLVADTEIEINATTIDMNGALNLSGNALVSGEVQTANIGYTDGDNAIVIADGGGITAAAGITSTAASNTFGATSFNDADITNVGSIALDTITNDGTDITIDAAGDIILDADGGDISLKDAGTEFGRLTNNSTNFQIYSAIQDADIQIKGNDGGSTVTALTLDMSNAGKAAFNAGATFNSNVAITTADNSDTLTLISTDADANAGPILVFDRTSSSPADNDLIGQIVFQARNDNAQDTDYAAVKSYILDASDGTEDGQYNIETMVGGTLQTRLLVTNTEIVLNESSIDTDFRVESDGNANMLFVDGGNNRVGIGGVPSAPLTVSAADGTLAVFTNTTSADLAIKTASGVLLITPSTGTLALGTSDTERMRIDSSGNLLVGTTSQGYGLFSSSRVTLGDGDAGDGFCVGGIHQELSAYTVQGNNNTGTRYAMYIANGSSSQVGSISFTSSATAYNTSSDGRLKDVTGSARGLEVINELNPVAYNWKLSGQADEGLIAQEVLDIVPNAVTGSEEDMYQMDYSKLVVHLVAGMKEQQTQIEALQSEINLLKGE